MSRHLAVASRASGAATARARCSAISGSACERGEFVALIGHSGCGKTTVLNILAGLEQPDAGRIVLDGRELSGPALDRAVIFQSHALLPWLTALGNVAFAVRVPTSRPVARPGTGTSHGQALALVGLSDAANRCRPNCPAA